MGKKITQRTTPRLWLAMILTAMAGGLGWGIRGQYGHETGAMMAGLLVGLTLVFLFCARAQSLFTARAAALFALGISIGGSMTYGQTVGLTHDAELIGNVEALRWGLLGLFIKGGIWIALGAALLGMALSATSYRPSEYGLVLLVGVFLFFLGVELLNRPFDPQNKLLPEIYFSDDWHWEPDRELEPRHEKWGGLLFAVGGVFLYAGILRRDRLARWMTVWGFLAGGIGFSAGQCVQAFHAWNPDLFSDGRLADADKYINWWNMMETSFGAIFGGVLALGLWLNRNSIRADEETEEIELKPAAEWFLVAIHVAALVAWNFREYRYLDFFADIAITMVLIPVIAVAAGRYWPYLVALPITALPIAGKTLRQLCYEEKGIGEIEGWLIYVAAPLVITTAVALVFARRTAMTRDARRFLRWSLLLTTWLYFTLNFAFFHFPLPWQEWTYRTPNGIIFAVCAVGLTALALLGNRRGPAERPEPVDESVPGVTG